jgi:hypothetical protein
VAAGAAQAAHARFVQQRRAALAGRRARARRQLARKLADPRTSLRERMRALLASPDDAPRAVSVLAGPAPALSLGGERLYRRIKKGFQGF